MERLRIQTRMTIYGDGMPARFIPSFGTSSNVFRFYAGSGSKIYSGRQLGNSMEVGSLIGSLIVNEQISFTREIDANSIDIIEAQRQSNWVFIGFEFSTDSGSKQSTTLTISAAGVIGYLPHMPYKNHVDGTSKRELITISFSKESARIEYGSTLNGIFASRAEAQFVKTGAGIARNLRSSINSSPLGALIN